MITVDEHGKVKRKVKKVPTQEDEARDRGLLMPDKDAKPLGMEVAMPAVTEEGGEEVDIFEGVGADYDPLEGLEDDEDDSDDEERSASNKQQMPVPEVKSPTAPSSDRLSMPPPPLPSKAATVKHNYFGEANEKGDDGSDAPPNMLTDPTILAALKKASTINPLSSDIPSVERDEEAAKLARRKKMLEAHDRDAEDMDLGFGSSRFGDEEDAEDKKVKLSVWGKEGGEDGRSSEGKGSRKRGAKKRKGDANSAADVLRVMERRKGEAK